MNKDELQTITQAAAKNIKTEKDLNQFRKMLTKITVAAALNAELTITWVISGLRTDCYSDLYCEMMG